MEVGKEDKFETFLATAHASSTQADYARVWKNIWPVFLATTTRGEDDRETINPYLHDVPNKPERCRLWAHFIYHLRGVAVKHYMKLSPVDMPFTDRQNGVVKMALLAARRRNLSAPSSYQHRTSSRKSV